MSDYLRDREPSFRDSPAESRRFGMSVARITVPEAVESDSALAWTRERLTSAPYDLVILRYPARHVTWAAALLDIGRDIVHADSLVYFTRLLTTGPTIPPLDLTSYAGSWSAARDRDVDPDALGDLVHSVFLDFSNHYAANPLLDQGAVLAGYREWVSASVRNDRVLCVNDEVGPVAFITWSDEGPVCQLHIGGVHPRAQGRGLFGAVLLGAAAAAQRAGCSELDSPTQVQNIRQLAVSWRIGLRAGGACNTVHVVRRGLLSPRRA